MTTVELEALIAAGAGASLLEWLVAWPGGLPAGVSSLGLAVQAHAAGGAPLECWQDKVARGLPAWSAELTALARQLAIGDWSVARQHADAIGADLTPRGALALAWLSGRATGALPEFVPTVTPLLDLLWMLGIAAVAEDLAQAARLAETILQDPATPEHLLVALAGDVPDTIFGFTAAAYEPPAA